MKRYRKVWLLAVIVLLGFWTGNLLSVTLVMGWSAEGIGNWHRKFLWSLSCCILIPIHQKNIYCNHLCPHGAIRQLVKPTKVSPRIRSLRGRIPSSLAIIAWTDFADCLSHPSVFTDDRSIRVGAISRASHPRCYLVGYRLRNHHPSDIEIPANGLLPLRLPDRSTLLDYLRFNAKRICST